MSCHVMSCSCVYEILAYLLHAAVSAVLCTSNLHEYMREIKAYIPGLLRSPTPGP